MFIKNNEVANQLYVPYTKNIRNLSQSARRLATGEKFPHAEDGAGEIGVSERWKNRMQTTQQLIGGLTSTMSYLAAQDATLGQAQEIVQRMSELAASALDTTKNTADRLALDNEFVALRGEFSDMGDRRYNGVSLFVTSLSVRVGVEVGANIVLSTISLGAIVFNGMGLSALASASSALISLRSRISSLNALRARSGAAMNEMQRTIDFTRIHISELGKADNQLRNIDLAIETGNFTKTQVMLAASQSVLSQSNNIVQSALQFLQ